MPSPDSNRGDSALTDALIGAAAGAVGVWVMDRVDWFMWSREEAATRAATTAARPDGEPPSHRIATGIERLAGADGDGSARVSDAIERLDRDALRTDPHHVAGTFVHYGIGVGPAVLYALYRDRLPMSGPARGALYGLALFGLQDEVANSLTGLGGRPDDYPWQAHARGLVAHLVYGMVTDLAIDLLGKPLARRPTLH